MTDTPKTSSEPQKPATPAPQQDQSAPKSANDKGEQQK